MAVTFLFNWIFFRKVVFKMESRQAETEQFIMLAIYHN